ncbi:hypothetical protein CCHL11_05173 [Colletotrichum chlorophyti]|uniref:DUF6606 domain-containing protein n=1 Tax=Colletotrichum chlorophyti TaxID=708187 RepID=A0A1Q8S233_9PEZI|nr:hypothetical protein CCHL11_05173 [Colletotrichum chlorophyti]
MEASRGPSLPAPAVQDALYNHLVLPAKLPQQRDLDVRLVENALVERMIGAAKVMCGIGLPDHAPADGKAWEALRQALVACRYLNRSGRVDKTSFLRELQQLGPDGSIILHIESQNAGLIIRRAQDPIFNDSVVFEAFEASPRNEDVLAAKTALQWDFPGIAVAVPYTTFTDNDFQTSLATFLEQASLETVKDFAAHAFKAGATVFEYRNTGDPSLISSLLMAILEENGRRVAPTLLRKRIRDDVCWGHAKRPWRRLPYYLVLRVGIQRHLSLTLGAEMGRLEYKFFISVLLATFLDDAPSCSIGTERLHFLKKKICRRLVKLDLDKDRCQDSKAASRHDLIFGCLGDRFKNSIDNGSTILHQALTQERTALVKQIPILPRKATDADLRLSLRVSSAYLNNALHTRLPKNARQLGKVPGSRAGLTLAEAAKDHLSQHAQGYHRLIDRETELAISTANSCSRVSQEILDYIDAAMPLYDGDPEQKSLMLLTVMELWQKMDVIACQSFPLLREFHPMFQPQMLDVLLLPHFSEIARLNTLQSALLARAQRANASARNIFEDPSPGCFGERYYTESADAPQLEEVHQEIVDLAKEMRDRKRKEWQKKTKDYDDLINRIDTSACVYLADEHNPLGRGRHDPNCPRCSMMWNAQNMRISIFEEPLPTDPVVARAVIFELACPPEFAVYRDTTWWILRHLATHFEDHGIQPRCLLRDYAQLKPFFRSSQRKLCLASTTKPFHITHYTSIPFPVEWEGGRDGVCRPNALKLGYYDERTSTWPGRTRFKPSFAHHTALSLPEFSPWNKLFKETRRSAMDGPGPSSYEIIASQSSCPAGINNHEFLAMQTLMSGKAQRWIVLLLELGSTNLSFSNEVTMLVVSHLVLQSGPRDDQGDVLRRCHKVLRDTRFCDRLIEQLEIHLDGVQAN